MGMDVKPRRFTVEEYYEMGRAGILHEDDRVELIEGEIVEMSPIGSRHAACVKRLIHGFVTRIGDRAVVSAQDPVRINRLSEPQPDLAVLQPRQDYYAIGHPGPEDVLLLIEVAETSANYDREVKLPLYARAGIPEVWLVDLEAGLVEVHRRPSDELYRDTEHRQPGESVNPDVFPELMLAVGDLVGST